MLTIQVFAIVMLLVAQAKVVPLLDVENLAAYKGMERYPNVNAFFGNWMKKFEKFEATENEKRFNMATGSRNRPG
jgi:hypothetical protein